MPLDDTIQRILNRHSLVSDQVTRQEIAIILRELQSVIEAGTKGDVVEFGCYVGTTSLFISRLLRDNDSSKTFHVYDSFEGLPDKTLHDSSPSGEQFKTGELRANKQTLIRNFKQAGLTLPIIHRGWFNQLTIHDIPEKIAFAFLDGDYYESIASSLRLISPHLSSGATIIVDDYMNEALPGAFKAVSDWLVHYPKAKLRRNEASLGIFSIT